MRQGRWFLRSAAIALVLGACSPNAPTSEDTSSADDTAREAERLANDQCITAALGNTIYKSQTDDALLSALFNQDLSGCHANFVQAYVAMRQAVRDYTPLAQEILEHAKSEGTAAKLDGANVLCSLFRGEQCASSFYVAWQSADADIRDRAKAARAVMDARRDEVEQVAAGYGIYARSFQEAQPAPIFGNWSTAADGALPTPRLSNAETGS